MGRWYEANRELASFSPTVIHEKQESLFPVPFAEADGCLVC